MMKQIARKTTLTTLTGQVNKGAQIFLFLLKKKLFSQTFFPVSITFIQTIFWVEISGAVTIFRMTNYP